MGRAEAKILSEWTRQRKAQSRFIMGRLQPGSYLMVTLTTPEGWRGDIHRAWRKTIARMRRRGMAREYFVVREFNQLGTCEHLHVVLRTKYVGAVALRAIWSSVLGVEFAWTYHKEALSVGTMAYYLSKYLAKYVAVPRERRYWYAYDWLYRGYIKFSHALWHLGKRTSVVDIWRLRSMRASQEQMRWWVFYHWLRLLGKGFFTDSKEVGRYLSKLPVNLNQIMEENYAL